MATRQGGTAADRRLAAACLEKRGRKEKTTREERAALRQIEKDREEESQWRHYGAIPKKHYVEMSGRPYKVLGDQATRYGLTALLGPKIHLPTLLRQFHDFLAGKLAGVDDGGPMPWKDQYTKERTRLLRLERRKREGQLLERKDVHKGLAAIARILRRVGEQLQREHGPEALKILNEGLEDAERKITSHFGAADGHAGEPDL